MIRVTVELIPKGIGEPEHLGTALFTNDARLTTQTKGNFGAYDVSLSKWKRPTAIWRRGRVPKFNRVTRGPWDLLLLGLLNTVGSRNTRDIRKWLEGDSQ